MKQFNLPILAGLRKYALLCATALVLPVASLAESKIFPVPDIIKENVAFWIRIYTEVSLLEGLLHDREYPQIVYEKVQTGSRSGRARSDFIDQRRKIYADAIINVRNGDESKWGAVEKQVAQAFKLAPEEALIDAENRIRHQTGQRERFRQGVERSGMYLDTISAILKQHGVPDELKYLPHVESSFDWEAYSKVGAAGLWQFMRATGRNYLRIDYMIDERRDPILSTHAAAKFLRANYNMLQRWPLAVTAYNHGPNGIRRAVAAVGSRDIGDIIERHESPTFKFASKNFYSCFVAVLQIMENFETYFPDIELMPRFEATSIKLPFAIRPDALSRSLGITEQQFRQLNPSLRPVVFTQRKPIPAGYSVNLPISISSKDALASLNRTPQPQRPTPTDSERGGYYTVAQGDNLHNIARRLGISMHELAAANNITNSSRIYVGQVLLIPSAITKDTASTAVPEDTIGTAAAQIPEVKEISLADVKEAAPVEKAVIGDKKAAKQPKQTAKTKPETVVKDTIRIINDNVKIVKDTVKTAAQPAPVIPIASASAVSAPAGDTLAAVALREAVPEPAANPNQKPVAGTYFDASVYDLGMTVAPGAMSVKVRVSVNETISHFAEWMNVSAAEIRRLNNLSANAGLQLGRQISIPIGRLSDLKKFEISRLEYHMATEEDFFARYTITDFDSKKVRSGESLWSICNEARIPLWLLKKFNRSTNILSLKPGDTIWIPRISARDSRSFEE